MYLQQLVSATQLIERILFYININRFILLTQYEKVYSLIFYGFINTTMLRAFDGVDQRYINDFIRLD